MKCQICHEHKTGLKRVSTTTLCPACLREFKKRKFIADSKMGVIVGNVGRRNAVALLADRVAAIKKRIDSGNDTKFAIKTSARRHTLPAKAPTFSKLQ